MTSAHARINDERGDYGYLTWLPIYRAGSGGYRFFAMQGSGGNKVVMIPELRSVVVITSENFGKRNAHALSQKLLEEKVLPALIATQ